MECRECRLELEKELAAKVSKKNLFASLGLIIACATIIISIISGATEKNDQTKTELINKNLDSINKTLALAQMNYTNFSKQEVRLTTLENTVEELKDVPHVLRDIKDQNKLIIDKLEKK